jgi:hypothetical protein
MSTLSSPDVHRPLGQDDSQRQFDDDKVTKSSETGIPAAFDVPERITISSGTLSPSGLPRPRGRFRASKIFYRTKDGTGEYCSTDVLYERIRSDTKRKINAVCIIEGITDVSTSKLNEIRGTFTAFAKRHNDRTSRKDDYPRVDEMGEAVIDGIYNYHTWKSSGDDIKVFRTAPTGSDEESLCTEWTTRISYYRITTHCCPYLCITPFCRANYNTDVFLVDKFQDPHRQSARNPHLVSLWAKFSTPPGGLILPQLFSFDTYSLFESLKNVFKHDWHFHVLFQDPPQLAANSASTSVASSSKVHGSTISDHINSSNQEQNEARLYDVIPVNVMLYLFSNCLWDTNLRLLDSCIQHISFRDLRDPKVETNTRLHDYREALEYLHHYTHEAVKGAPTSPSMFEYFEKLRQYYRDRNVTIYNPVGFLSITHKEAEDVQQFLMETFQLLMSSISVRDSSLSAQQAFRTTILTYLAILYLPLTVSTGIFGMNIKEINNGTPKFWWVIVVMLILMLSTVVVYRLLQTFQERKVTKARLLSSERQRTYS